jgi:hypothetical protein
MAEQFSTDLTAQLIARVWKDEAFKQELLSDPTAVVERELRRLDPELALPEHVQIKVLEESASERYLVLPANPMILVGEELSDSDLDRVAAAGGRVYTFDASTSCSGNPACNVKEN